MIRQFRAKSNKRVSGHIMGTINGTDNSGKSYIRIVVRDHDTFEYIEVSSKSEITKLKLVIDTNLELPETIKLLPEEAYYT